MKTALTIVYLLICVAIVILVMIQRVRASELHLLVVQQERAHIGARTRDVQKRVCLTSLQSFWHSFS